MDKIIAYLAVPGQGEFVICYLLILNIIFRPSSTEGVLEKILRELQTLNRKTK